MMDAVTVNVIWLALWFLGIWVLPYAAIGVFAVWAHKAKSNWGIVPLVVGLLLALFLFILGIVQTILHVISLVQLLT